MYNMSKFSVLGGLWAWRQICGNKGEDSILEHGMEEGQCQSWWDIAAHLHQISVRTSEVNAHNTTFCSCPGDRTLLNRNITSLRCLVFSSKETSVVRRASQEPSRWTALISNSFPIICKLCFWSLKHSAFWSPLKVVSSMPRILEKNTVVSLISLLSPWCGQDYVYDMGKGSDSCSAMESSSWRDRDRSVGIRLLQPFTGTGFQQWIPGISSVMNYLSVPLIWNILVQSLLGYLNPLASPEYPLGVWLAPPCWISLPMNHISNGSGVT